MEDSGRIVITDDEIEIPAVGRIAKADVLGAWIENDLLRPRVMIDVLTSERAIWIKTSSIAEAREIVAALGFANVPRQRITYAAKGSDERGRVLAVTVLLVLLSSLAIGGFLRWLAPFVTVSAFFTARILLDALEPVLTIDDDGVAFHNLLGRERLSFAEVAAVHERRFEGHDEIVIVLADKRVRSFVTQRAGAHPSTQTTVSRLRRALAAYRERKPPSDLELRLRRNGRTNEAWLRDLRALRGDERYRVASVDEEELRKTAEDSAKPVHLRVAAGIALHSADEGDDTEARIAELDSLDREER
ncbi:MAG TPA: hypothetical protein VF407_08730 [Polyangiaceae bacterium]